MKQRPPFAAVLRDGRRYQLPDGEIVIASLIGSGDDGEEPGWVLYTEHEWRDLVNADMDVSDNGSIRFLGRHTGWNILDLTPAPPRRKRVKR